MAKVEHAYGESEIQILEGLDPVRKRPGMYIGSTDARGLHHLITEIVDNSIDEALAGYCSEISVIINADGSCSVRDNGRGIPTGIHKQEGISAVEVVLTKLHAGGKFGGGGYKISGGLHGVGLSVVNALSKNLKVEIFQDGNHFFQEYHRGVPTAPLQILGDAHETGTKVTFVPDDEIFETCVFEYDTVKKRIRELAYLNKGLVISMQDLREGKEKQDRFHFEGGIAEFVDNLNQKKEIIFPNSFYFEKPFGECVVEIAMQYNDSFDERIFTFANNIGTEEGGAHLDGFKTALTKVVNSFAKGKKIIKDDESLSGEDVREGLVAVISVKLPEPQFEGQTKTKLGNSEMRGYVSRAISEDFATFLEENPARAKEVIMKSITAKKAREAARNARELTRRKNAMEGNSMPGKLSDCTEKNSKYCEIYIVEGDSAGGTAKQGRDRRFQAILPLRGKILNVQKARESRIFENEEIKAMITAFGCGINEDFNEDNLRYDRIICMTDADVDGSHIRILLLTFFYRFMRPLIELGHVYIAQPPLFMVKKGGNSVYFYEEAELEAFLAESGKKESNANVQRYKGLGEMDHHQLWETTMDPQNRTLLQVTMEDAVTADDIFTVLMGEKPELRREFIEKNAKIVEELDV
ncbi:MAG: DNA topoisomerase (ATP-hydrolyzing) subunit B [Bacillota bacterium]